MKPHHLEFLKHIALQGGIHDFAPLSTKKMGTLLGISQQSASNRILELAKLGFVVREFAGRAQRLKLTKTGMDAIRKEYADYQRIFDLKGLLTIKGVVTSGLGEGQYYMQQKGYYSQFTEKLGFKPYMGTLNLKLIGNAPSKLEVLKKSHATLIEGFKSGERTFGDVNAYPATIKNLSCAVIIPTRSHHMNVLEVISQHYLRGRLNLKNGDLVELRIPI